MKSEKINSFDAFIQAINQLHVVYSVQGVKYSGIFATRNEITGLRESTHKGFSIKSQSLYQAYQDLDISNLTTAALKPYVDRVQSPSLAILKALI